MGKLVIYVSQLWYTYWSCIINKKIRNNIIQNCLTPEGQPVYLKSLTEATIVLVFLPSVRLQKLLSWKSWCPGCHSVLAYLCEWYHLDYLAAVLPVSYNLFWTWLLKDLSEHMLMNNTHAFYQTLSPKTGTILNNDIYASAGGKWFIRRRGEGQVIVWKDEDTITDTLICRPLKICELIQFGRNRSHLI